MAVVDKLLRPTCLRYIVCNPDDTAQLWKGLSLSTGKLAKEDHVSQRDDYSELMKEVVIGELCCQSCLIDFSDAVDHRNHYREDLHRYNLKLKLKGKPPVSFEEFSDLQDDISSISGSDSDEHDEEDAKKIRSGSPKIIFQNSDGQKMSVFRCLLHSKKNVPNDDGKLLQLLETLPVRNHWAIIMLGGGHFAAAIYKGTNIVCHKTFHSYTVRAKQGGSQSSRDNKSGGGSHPKSAGASLRRYNEAAFSEHVHDTMQSWHKDLNECHIIMYRAASSNQTILFGGKNHLFDRNDPRLRSIPFPTRRATLKEVKRVWLTLATIQLLMEIEEAKDEPTEDFQSDEDSDPQTTWSLQVSRSPPKVDKKRKEESDPEDYFEYQFPGEKDILEAMAECIVQGNLATFNKQVDGLREILAAYREEYHLDLCDVLNQRYDAQCQTLLHKAASARKPNLIWTLLELGCDPSLADTLGRAPYLVAADKESRNAFRRFMGQYPERYDYGKACIPSPLTDELERQKQDKLDEKRKRQRQLRKERKKEEKLHEAKLHEEEAARLEQQIRQQEEEARLNEERRKAEEEKQRFLQLSDREKRALAAERRMLANMAASGLPVKVLVRCFLCGLDISTKVPFEYDANKFCSMPCLQKHRKSTCCKK